MASLLRHIVIPIFSVIEHGVIDDLPRILRRHHLHFSKFGVLSGCGPTQKYGQLLFDQLSAEHQTTQAVVNDNTADEVARIEQWMLNEPVDVVVAVGGGRVLDVAKAACASRHQTLILMPTSLSSDSISSPIAVIKDKGKTRSLPGQPPLGLVVDLDVMRDVPVRLLRAGLGDLISNLSAAYDWRLARDHRREPHDAATEAMARLPADRMLKRIFHSGPNLERDDEFLRELSEGLVLSGIAMGISANSRPCSGSEHMISHAIDHLRSSDFLHGEQVLVGTYFTLQLQGQTDCLNDLRTLASQIGLPMCPSDIDVTREMFFKALQLAPSTRPGRFTILDLKTDVRELEESYDLAYGPPPPTLQSVPAPSLRPISKI